MKINVNGLAVYLNGKKTNPPIIFVHAFPHDRRMWDEQVEFLSNDFFVVTYDVRGFGESDIADGQYTMEQYADELISVVENIGLVKPVVCGLSMGGYIILRALEKSENIFSAAILMDTRSEADDNQGKLKRAAAIKTINENGLEGFVKDFVKNCVWENSIETNNKGYIKALDIATSQKSLGVKGALLAMVSRTDTRELLPKLNLPVSVICGKYDKLTPPEMMREMSKKIPNAEFTLIENAGHLSNLENPNEVNKAIGDFLKKIFE